MKKFLAVMMLSLVCMWSFATPSHAEEKTYRAAWSHYTGWEPWEYARESGILKKWADKYGIKIELTLVNDYVESINLYTAGKFDACVMTNMDALTIPAVGGVDSEVNSVGDCSYGNDGIATNDPTVITMKDLKGKDVKGVEFSVSHYATVRALEQNGMTEQDIRFVNVSDADIGSLFATQPNCNVVTWNPILMNVRNVKGAKLLFTSAQIPGEIIDMMVVHTDAPEAFKKALAGAWYEVMATMTGKGKATEDAIAYMAKTAGGTTEEFKAQLKTTAMFYTAAEAAEFTKSYDLKRTMEYVRTFSYNHGLYGQGSPSKDLVGIQFPDGSVIGDKNNIKLRFNSTYMKLAADGKL